MSEIKANKDTAEVKPKKEFKAVRTYKYCKVCKEVEEMENGLCLVCDTGNKIHDPDRRTLAFKVKKWRRRVNESSYNRDKMKDLAL